MRRGPKKRSKAEVEARARFDAEVMARDGECVWAGSPCGRCGGTGEGPSGSCLMCNGTGEHVCEGPHDAHHIIRAQTLRANFSTFPEEEKWQRVFDPDIATRVCRALHTPLTSKAWHLRPEDVRDRAREWAKKHRIAHLLEREVPGLRVDLTGDAAAVVAHMDVCHALLEARCDGRGALTEAELAKALGCPVEDYPAAAQKRGLVARLPVGGWVLTDYGVEAASE